MSLYKFNPLLVMQLALASLINSIPPSLKSKVNIKRRRGSTNSMGGLVVALMVVAITVAIGLVVFYNVWPSLTALQDTDFTADANTTITNTEAYFIDAVGLLIIGFIVMGAVAIISIVGMLRGAV